MTSSKKQVQIIARVAFKADARKVCYLVRASNGVGQYTTCLFNGKACSCSCPANGNCYHRVQVEQIEAARSASVVAAPAAPVETPAIEASKALVAERKVAREQAVLDAQMARVARRQARTEKMAAAGLSWARETAPITSNRGFSFMR